MKPVFGIVIAGLASVSSLLGFQLREFEPSKSGLEPQISFRVDLRNAAIRIEWTAPGTLLSGPTVDGPWTEVEGVRGFRFNLLFADAVDETRFFRVLPLADTPKRATAVHIPEGYNQAQQYPLILNLHGFASTPEELESLRFPLAHLVDEREFLYCTPAGLPEAGVAGFDNPRGWNATDACCKTSSVQSRIDDVVYLTSVVEWIVKNYSVDARRIFATGHSNGGYMVHRLLCDRSDLFAAGVSHAGVSWMDPSQCRPSDPVNILHIHSLTDEIVNFDGGVAFGQHPGVLQTLRDWADRLGCAGELTETEVTLELDLAVPGRETTIFRYAGCENSAVELWRKSSGKHWPTLQKDGIETDLSNAVVDWLFSHPKAEAAP